MSNKRKKSHPLLKNGWLTTDPEKRVVLERLMKEAKPIKVSTKFRAKRDSDG